MPAAAGAGGLGAGPHPVFRGRRRGRRPRAGLRALLRDRLPEIAIDPAALADRIDPRALFDTPPREVRMEIGFGAGEHLAWQAERAPDVGFIGCEPYINGVAGLLRHVEERGLSNIRVLADDARPFLPRLPDACLARVDVLFPDPWPKRRHAARRIVQWETVAGFERLLRPGGELRLATDDAAYLRWMLERTTGRPGLEWLAERPADWRARPPDWPPTRYEAKAIAAGRAPAFLRLRRTGVAPGPGSA